MADCIRKQAFCGWPLLSHSSNSQCVASCPVKTKERGVRCEEVLCENSAVSNMSHEINIQQIYPGPQQIAAAGNKKKKKEKKNLCVYQKHLASIATPASSYITKNGGWNA